VLNWHRAFAAAWLSFVPYIGVLFGAIAVVRGLSSGTRRGRAIVAIGATGIIFNLLFFVLRLWTATQSRSRAR
jgi:hypothetical protein